MNFFSLNKFHVLTSLSKHLDIVIDNKIDPLNSDRTFIGWNWFSNEKVFEARKKKGLQSVCVERGALPETIFLDINGFNYNSSSYNQKNWDKPLSFQQKNLISEYIKDYKQNANLTLEKQDSSCIDVDTLRYKIIKRGNFKKVIFIPLQVPNDTVVKRFPGLIKSYENFLQCVKDLSRAFPHFAFVYKNHPLEKTFNSEDNNLICADESHFKACLEICDAVLTINSGVGLQALIYNKPTYIVGDAYYENKFLNVSIKEKNDIGDSISTNFIPNKELTLKFLYWLRFEFYSSVKWTEKNHNRGFSYIESIEKLNIWRD